ncbi:hypothetical protein RN001_000140 [Aquatica leii]|uniref:ABC transporter domain-containing protein n=1 Tax=Aquatica leii TaxID=1421715 RepID=A0AAN7PEJ0_9COLE|nr:hypothetical protein RN001_000140 [Aquatica leii]
MYESPTGKVDECTMSSVFTMLLLDSVLYLVIALYLEKVCPGPYGISKPFYFPCKNLFQCFVWHNNVDPEPYESVTHKIQQTSKLPIGIYMRNVCKDFENVKAVNNVSFKIYKGQITGLLGHHGSGKSTIISILAGMVSVSSGQVVKLDHDIESDLYQKRNSLGICLQENILFAELSVIEQLTFFGIIKGLSKTSAYKEACSLLRRFNLTNYKPSLVSQLSNGMKRKLSICIAIIGNPKVLLLDEPTVGLDEESSRVVWDMLLSLRHSRVIVFSTQSMTEADILADQIAIFHQGNLVCYGTPSYLRTEYDAKYYLVITFDKVESSKTNQKKTVEIIFFMVALTTLSLYTFNEQNSYTSDKAETKMTENGRLYYSACNDTLRFAKTYRSLAKKYTNDIQMVPNVHAAIINKGLENLEFYKNNLIAATEFNKSSNGSIIINALYSDNSVESAPISFSLAINTALKEMVNSDASIRCTKFPTETHSRRANVMINLSWYFIFAFGLLCNSGKFLVFPMNEKITNVKHLQLSSGVHFSLYWIVCFIWDLIFSIALIGAIFLVILVYEECNYLTFYGANEFGANGSGKTTFFRVVTGDCMPTTGDARIKYENKRFYVSSDLKKYCSMVGYCPQSNGIMNYLTGREMLYLFGKIRGLSGRIDNLVSLWMDKLDMEVFSNTLCKDYSKGDKRKLSIGIALIGSPLVVFLDEPTAGVDLETYTNLSNFLNLALKQHNNICIILGTHDPSICESMCNKMGFTVKLQLNIYKKQFLSENIESSETLYDFMTTISTVYRQACHKKVRNMMNDIQLIYKELCVLKNRNNYLLHYHIQDKTKKWEEVYKEISDLQYRHPIIENYEISDLSLEETFLSIN